MKKVVLYGAGDITKKFLREETVSFIVNGIVDRNWENIVSINGYKVASPDEIDAIEYDYVIIALDDLKKGNEKQIFDIYRMLQEKGIPSDKIVLQSFKSMEHHVNRYPRAVFLREMAELMRLQQMDGAVAECGVYRGWFSSMINEAFPEKRLWLFDTFEGFDDRDIDIDLKPAQQAIKNGQFDQFYHTSVDLVKLRCPYRENLMIKKGYVPDTFKGVEDSFCFVNLDMDLYAPQLAAMRFFAARMVPGGIILVHDYYNKTFTGTKKAVDEFIGETNLKIMPIGDGLSIAILF